MTEALGIEGIQAVRLYAALHVRGLSVVGLAMLSGVSDRTVNRINTDPTYRPHAATWERLADALRCDLAWLRDGVGFPFYEASGRLGLVMATNGVTPEGIAHTLKGMVEAARIAAFLRGEGELTPPEITLCAITLRVESRWILHGTNQD